MPRRVVSSCLALALAGLVTLAGGVAEAADTTKVNQATKQVEQGTKKIGDGKVGDGVEETAKGIGDTIVEGAKFTGEKFKEAAKAADSPHKDAGFGTSVKNFFNKLFSN